MVVATTYGRKLEVQEGVSPKEGYREKEEEESKRKRKTNTHTLCRMKVLRPMPTEER